MSTIEEDFAGQRVFPIEYHVDYWDYLGWTDPFADEAYTARQTRYAQALGLSGMYTPMTLVNFFETNQFNAGTVTGVVNTFLDDEVDVSTTIWLDSDADASPLVINYMVDGAPEGSELSVVLVEGGISVDITAGENNGATLAHNNVARGMTTVTGDLESGQLEIVPQEGIEPTGCSLFAFVQDTADLSFSGATGIPLVSSE